MLLSLLLILLPGLTGCGLEQVTTAPPAVTPLPSQTPIPESMVTFRVTLPEPLPQGDTLILKVLDEVTGLALNTKSFRMEAEDAQHYLVILPFTLHSVIKYRYSREGSSMAEEHLADGRAVRYRLYSVDGPGFVQDYVSRWTDTQFKGPNGRITGAVTDAKTGEPIPNILVTAGGAQTLTAADGSYLLQGLPPGTHNIVAYALDGAYQTFQQGAMVAADSATPAPLKLNPSKMVKLVFTVAVPSGTLPAIPVRLAGNLYQLGNTFADLSGGVSAQASRMPVLSALPDGRYSITLELPVGADIRYKYTLGDGFWNAEHATSGDWRVRQLIVPETSQLISDQVDTWGSGKSAPITFDTTVPANTPPTDSVSIQFNPSFGWTEALPMWPVAKNRWVFVLYSPLDALNILRFRYCRNEQCGSADDARTAGPQAAGQYVNTSILPETIDIPVASWNWLGTAKETITLPNVTIRSRGPSFIAGVELQAGYQPSWQAHFTEAIKDIRQLNANWVFLTPGWTFTHQNLPVLEPLPGKDPLWQDIIGSIAEARAQSLITAVFPTPSFPGGSESWWKSSTRDFSWWQVWFERYHTFLIHYADLANRNGIKALVIGGDWLSPALPDGKLPDGNASMVPEDAAGRWQNILKDVRSHFKGTLIWAWPFPAGVKNPPAFLNQVDQIYLLWSASLAQQGNPTEQEMAGNAGKDLDKTVKPLVDQLKKPVILGLAYPSAKGGSAGCVQEKPGACLNLEALNRPNPDISSVSIDLLDQAKAYDAMMLAINERDWLSGIVSRGYYPPASLQDKSVSIHGKPSWNVLWYWFPRFLGLPAQ
ncbi:MAG: carboxypeptidase regulatory-like domain-containing protein [Omnitrophica WOR_2 bacterium]